MVPKVFIDANILIAGSGSRTGASRAVLVLGEIGMIQLFVNQLVIDEAERNIRQKLPKALPTFAELLIHLNLQILENPEPQSFRRWFNIIEEKDAPILESAVQISADYLISLNSKDFTDAVGKASGLKILTPAAFIENARDILSRNL